MDFSSIKRSINKSIINLSEKNRIERKIKFLLDIRGILVLNGIKGDYVEWGVYKGEMMFAAAKILSKQIDRFVGLDTFIGLPNPDGDDQEYYTYESEGGYESSMNYTKKMMEGFKYELIVGDFRETTKEFDDKVSDISVAALDCNWPSSLKIAFDKSVEKMLPGSLMYIDDYYFNTSKNDIFKDMMFNFIRK